MPFGIVIPVDSVIVHFVLKEGVDLLGLKDQEMQRYNKNPNRRADLFNGTVFHGKQVIEAEYLKEAPRKKSVYLKKSGQTVQKKEYSGQVGIRYLERERDILSFHDHPEKKCYIACEGQSDADYGMPLRDLMYDGVEYSEQLRQEENKGKKSGGLTRPLIPVFHLTLYTGEKRWLRKHSLQEMMDIPEQMEQFRELLPDYRTYIVDIHEQNPDLFRTEWKDVFRLMGHSRKKEELREYMKVHIDEIRRLSMDTRMFMAVLLDQYEIIEDEIVEVKEMSEAWDGAVRLEAEEVAKGMAAEIAEGMAAEMAERIAEKKAEKKIEEMMEGLRSDIEKEVIEKVARDEAYRKKLFAAYKL